MARCPRGRVELVVSHRLSCMSKTSVAEGAVLVAANDPLLLIFFTFAHAFMELRQEGA